MPMRYGEKVLAARGGMARAAVAQGRDERPMTEPTREQAIALLRAGRGDAPLSAFAV
jgi:hypothetical protein